MHLSVDIQLSLSMVTIISNHLPTGHSLFQGCLPPWTLTTLGDRNYAVSGPRVWNSLLATLHRSVITSYGQFRQHLKMHLFTAADCD